MSSSSALAFSEPRDYRGVFVIQKLLSRANAKGKPEYMTQTINGVSYTVVKVADKFYVPDRTQTI